MRKLIPMFLFSALLWSCNNDDDAVIDDGPGESKEFAITALDNDIEGTLTFTDMQDGSTTIDIELDGTEEGTTYLAYLRHESAAEQGDIALSLEPVDGATGLSTTTATSLDDETSISYEDLIEFDGHLIIFVEGEQEEEIPVAYADLGENQLTGESFSFDLVAVGDSEVNGQAIFEERESGETLVSIFLEGTEEGNSHPAQIRVGSTENETEELGVALNPVNGGTGKSLTHVANLDQQTQDGQAITYEELIALDGHINIYLSQEENETVIAQGNISDGTSEE